MICPHLTQYANILLTKMTLTRFLSQLLASKEELKQKKD